MPVIGSIASRKKKEEQTQKQNNDSVLVPKKLLTKLLSLEKPEPEVQPLQTIDQSSDILTNIYNVMRMDHDSFMKNMIADKKFNKNLEKLKESRVRELIDLFSGKKIERQRKAQVKKEIEQLKKKLNEIEERSKKLKTEEPSKPSVGPVPSKPTGAPTPAVTTPAPKTTTAPPSAPVTPPAATAPRPSAVPAAQPKPSVTPVIPVTPAQTAVVAAGVTLSSAALATMKAEQSVTSAEDAIAPNNNKKRVAKGEFPDLQTPKLGAATPDVRNSTSYGLFGINNIRKVENGKPVVGSSSIDSFVKMFPEFELPDPGDPSNRVQVDSFNNAWWKLAKEKPDELLKAQSKWFTKRFEEPAKKDLMDKVPSNIADDPGVQLYMIDRRTQFGGTMLQSALKYASSAKTPKEFIRLVSEHDRINLRQIFKSTPDSDYAKIEKGLLNRIELREKKSFEVTKNVNLQQSIPNYDTGNNLDQKSRENKDLKRQPAPTVAPNVNILNTNNNVVNGSNIYETPTENTHTPALLTNQYK